MKGYVTRKDKDGKEYHDYPFEEIIKKAFELSRQGVRCYQKFSCERCSQRLVIDLPNTFYEKGSCDQCGHITDLKKNGCNFSQLQQRG